MAHASITVEGGLFPSDLLDKIATGDVEGQKPADFRLDGGRLADEIQSAFSDARAFWDTFQRRLQTSRESTTTLTRESWIKPFLERLGFDLETKHASAEIGGQLYFVSHRAGDDADAPPVHVVSVDQALDRRDGTARRSPHALVQELLNRSDALWGIATNGNRLRLLRDSSRQSKPTYLEFDLEGMIAGNLYSEFVLLYRLIHASRFPHDGASAHECLLEKYHAQGIEQGGRVREKLRDGVEESLRVLGSAFLKHPDSEALRDKLASGQLDAPRYYRQLLRLVYRFLFLMVAEERRLVFPPDEVGTLRQNIYSRYYSIARLRDRADRYFAGDAHLDLWLGLRETFALFRDDENAKKLGLSALNGELFGPNACVDLERAACENKELLGAIRCLSTFLDEEGAGHRRRQGVRRRVNYAALDVEEFGSVYESLLDFHPQIESDGWTFDLVTGSERKQTGSYYTPPELVHELIQSALVPVIEERLAAAKTTNDKERDLLLLRVCDPAAGSGHFLLAAARRIARELAKVRSGEDEPAPEEYRHALRDVIRNCIYAVDKNPLAVDLCKVALWIEGHNAGLPLSFLDAHVRHGDSLVGVFDLNVLAEGIPDDAYTAVTGDDKPTATAVRKRNRLERDGQTAFAADGAARVERDDLASEFSKLAAIDERTPDDVHAKEERYERLRSRGSEWWRTKVACDLWTYAFFAPATPERWQVEGRIPTTNVVRKQLGILSDDVREDAKAEAVQFAQGHPFFHWPLEFPDVFANGGFDAILGNPPWDLLEAKGGEAASADFALLQNWFKSNQYAVLNGRRDLYKLFLVNCARLARSFGRLGFLTPLGVFIEDDSAGLRQRLFDEGSVLLLRHFQNHKKRFFPNVHASYRFCAVVFTPTQGREHSFSTVARLPEELSSQYFVTVPRDEFGVWLGPTRSATIYPSEAYALLHRTLLEAFLGGPVLTYRIVAEFHASSDKEAVMSSCPKDGWALLKNRNIHYFNHVYAPHEAWVRSKAVQERLHRKGLHEAEWFSRNARLVFRDIARNDDERSLIACLIPPGTVSTYDTPMIVPECSIDEYQQTIAFCTAAFSAFLVDFLVRPFIDKHVKGYTLARVPWPSPERLPKEGLNLDWFVRRVLELVYITAAFKPFAEDCGWFGSQFAADEERRNLLRCELDAAIFHLVLSGDNWPSRNGQSDEQLSQLKSAFSTPRDAVAYVLESFSIVRETDVRQHGEYRTKRMILEIYDEMAKAIETGEPYQTRLDPPPADPRVAHSTSAAPA